MDGELWSGGMKLKSTILTPQSEEHREVITQMNNTRPPSPASVPLVLWITFLGSMGTAVVTTGIAFIADKGLGYSGRQNLLLALALGGVYIPAAYFSGPALLRAMRRSRRITTRRVLVGLMLVLTAVAQLPLVAHVFFNQYTEAALWVMGIVFMAATGVQWPIVHAYLSGGRRGRAQRSAIGKFNITWATALVLAFWSMAPLLKHHPFVIVSVLGAVHLVIAVIVLMLPDEPAKHVEDDSLEEGDPELYRQLLVVFRTMLIASYVILSVMTPLLPSIETKLGLPAIWWTPVASTWLVVRIVFFALLERWHGWHGRWLVPWVGMGTLVIGFAIAMIAPMVGPYAGSSLPNELGQHEFNALGLMVLMSGLALAGVGISLTYYGALYYAMAVGGADVEAGGKHEAFIGVGYTAGPLCGLIGGLVHEGGLGVIGVTSAVVIGMIGLAVTKALKSTNRPVSDG